MLNQTFSEDNFRKIFDIENRKGKNIEKNGFFSSSDLFKESRRLVQRLIEINTKIRQEIKWLKKIKNYSPDNLNSLKTEKNQVINERDQSINIALIEIAKIVNKSEFKIQIIKKNVHGGKQIYSLEDTAESFFVSKQIQKNINKTFKVKQSDRDYILSQLTLLLDDNFPKIIMRTDVQDFYESIPHDFLIKKIDNNSLLDFSSKKVIKGILNQYWLSLVADGHANIDDKRKGIPRGIGISAYLSELYLRDFDKKVSSLYSVTSYFRYVDDIFIIFTPQSRKEIHENRFYKVLITNTLREFNLKINNRLVRH